MGVLTMVPASRGGSLGSEVGAWKAIELVARRGWRRRGKFGDWERESVIQLGSLTVRVNK